MRCAIRGVKPASEARVRTARSSAVLRELTIQSCSAHAARSATGEAALRRPRARPGPRPSSTAAPPSSCGQRGRRQVVVVGQREVEVVVGEQRERLERLVLAAPAPGPPGGSPRARPSPAAASPGPPSRTRRPAGCRPAPPSGSRSARAASTAARIVTAWSASRRPAGVSRTRRPSGSTSERADLAGQRGDLLRDRRRRQPVRLGHRAHRAEPRQLEEEAQPAEVHARSLFTEPERWVCSNPRGREGCRPS